MTYRCIRCRDEGGKLGGKHCESCCASLSYHSNECPLRIFKEIQPGQTVRWFAGGVTREARVTGAGFEDAYLQLENGSKLYRAALGFAQIAEEDNLETTVTPAIASELLGFLKKNASEPNLFEKLSAALETTVISKSTGRTLGSEGALAVFTTLMPIFSEAGVKISAGFESVTWVEEKCGDAFCSKTKNHPGGCSDEPLAVANKVIERTGVREVTLDKLVAEAIAEAAGTPELW